MGDEASLTHHQHVAEPAGIFPKILDLLIDLIRGAGKDVAARHLIIQRRSQRNSAAGAAAFQELLHEHGGQTGRDAVQKGAGQTDDLNRAFGGRGLKRPGTIWTVVLL